MKAYAQKSYFFIATKLFKLFNHKLNTYQPPALACWFELRIESSDSFIQGYEDVY